jgi:hypothetical protein
MVVVKLFAILVSASVALAAVAILLSFYSASPQGVAGQSTIPPANPEASGVRFDNAINLTNNTQDSVYGQVVATGDNVYVIWQDSVPSSGSPGERYTSRNYDIFVMRSIDGGDSFEPAVNLSNNPGFSEHPQAASDDTGIHAVWADNSPGNREVLYSMSKDNGTSFETMQNLSDTSSDSFNQEIAVFKENVYVVWLEDDDNGSRVMFRASHDAGSTFEEAVAISDKANVATLPKVAADSQGVHVAWSLIDDELENGLFYTNSSDGRTFGEPKKLSDQNDFGEPQIVADNSTVYVVSGGLDVIEVNGLFVAKSSDGGATFSSEMLEMNGTFVNPLNVEAAVSGSTLYVAGQVFVSNNEEILLLPLQFESNSTSPLGLHNLSENPKISECPSIAISGDRIFVVWEDLSPGNHEILYAKGMKK